MSMRKKNLEAEADSVERVLEKEIALLVFDAIGQYPMDVSCTFISESDLAILIESVKTPLEDFLNCSCRPEVVQKYRQGVEFAMGKRVHRLVEKVINRQVNQVSITRKTDTRWMGIFAIL